MQNCIEAIKERIASLNDETLIKIVTEDADDYEAEALQIAGVSIIPLLLAIIESILSTIIFHFNYNY